MKQSKEKVSPIEILRHRCSWSAEAVEGSSPRKEIRNIRARMMLIFHEICPPLDSNNLIKDYYVKGAVVRLSSGLLKLYFDKMFPDVKPPNERSIGDHVRALENVLAIIRQPGKPKPYIGKKGEYEKRPRWADTIHIIYNEKEAEWWANVGNQVMRSNAKIRRSSRIWETYLGHWRSLPDVLRQPKLEEAKTVEIEVSSNSWKPDKSVANELSRLVRSADLSKTIEYLVGNGVDLGQKLQDKMILEPQRALATVATLVIAIKNDKDITSAGGWLNTVFNSGSDLDSALEKVSEIGFGLSPEEAGLEIAKSTKVKNHTSSLDIKNVCKLICLGADTKAKMELSLDKQLCVEEMCEIANQIISSHKAYRYYAKNLTKSVASSNPVKEFILTIPDTPKWEMIRLLIIEAVERNHQRFESLFNQFQKLENVR